MTPHFPLRRRPFKTACWAQQDLAQLEKDWAHFMHTHTSPAEVEKRRQEFAEWSKALREAPQ